jgi:hypothetical protein
VYEQARFDTLLSEFDTDNDETITFQEFKNRFQLIGYQFVANRKIRDKNDSSIDIHSNDYNYNLQIEANEYVRSQKDRLHDYMFHDLPNNEMLNGKTLIYKPDLETTQLIKEFWKWFSTGKIIIC